MQESKTIKKKQKSKILLSLLNKNATHRKNTFGWLGQRRLEND